MADHLALPETSIQKPASRNQHPLSRIGYLYKQNGKYFLDAPLGAIVSAVRQAGPVMTARGSPKSAIPNPKSENLLSPGGSMPRR